MVSSVTLGNYFSSGGKTVFGGTGGSGLDTQSIITALVNAKSIPATQAQDKIKVNATQTAALGEFQTLISKLQDAANFLRNPPGVNNQADNIFKYTKPSITSNTSVSGLTYVTATTSPGASVQTYTIDSIESVARSRKQATDSFVIASPETAIVKTSPAAGEFKAGTFTFKGVPITLNDGDTLNTVVSKFNTVSNTTGVTANIIKVDGNHYQISFVATESGTAHDFDFNGADLVDPDDVFLLAPAVNPGQEATDAIFTLNGVEITRSTNSISDVVDGLTLTLFQATPVGLPVTTITLDIKRDETLVRDGVVNFVNAYNDFKAFVAKQTEVDDNGRFTAGAILASNASFRQIANDITTQVTGIASRMIMPASGSTAAKSAITFTDLAKSAESPLVRNVLAVDEGTLTSIISTNPDEVRRAFTFDFSSDNASLQVFSRTNALKVGSFSLTANPYASQVTQTLTVADADTAFVSAAPGAGGIKAGSITINGQVITLVDGDTLNQVIAKFAAVQATSGMTATLNNTGTGTYTISFASTVATGNNQFNLKSATVDTNGLFANVDVTATGSYNATYTLGGQVTTVAMTSTIGQGGTIMLTGPSGSALEGLKLLYSSSAADTTEVTVTQGFGDRIYNAASSILNQNSGILAIELSSIKERDNRLMAQINNINEQVERFRQQLLDKFAALEQAIARVNNLLQSITASTDARNNS